MRTPSRQQGGAGEFVDFREYSGSEDLRRLDWKVLGRTGQGLRPAPPGRNQPALHPGHRRQRLDALRRRLTQSKRDRCGSKLEYVQYLATALSHVISRGQDQVGLAVLDERLRDDAPAGRRPASHLCASCRR